MRAVLNAINRRAAFHSEDEYRLRERMNLRVEGDPRSHPVWRDATAALMCTQRLVRLAHETGKRVHVLHVTTKEEAAFLADHKDVATAEATPAHLTLAAPDCYERLGTLAQLNPPIRDAAHRAGVWDGVAQGVIDSIGSDHSPHTREEKAQPYPKTHSGMTGVQTLVPIMLDHVNAGRLSLARFVDLTSAGPARVFGIARKGRIAAGYDADLTVVDLKRRETITDGWIASRAGWTPYNGVTVTGWPVGTFVRGQRGDVGRNLGDVRPRRVCKFPGDSCRRLIAPGAASCHRSELSPECHPRFSCGLKMPCGATMNGARAPHALAGSAGRRGVGGL